MTARARWLGVWCAIASAVTGRHFYLSTGCLHGGEGHAYCQIEARRYDGSVKTASSCKTCAVRCRCRCHRKRAAHAVH